MKVRVVFTLEVDAPAWDEEFGTGPAAAVREDVLSYVNEMVSQCRVADDGLWIVQ